MNHFQKKKKKKVLCPTKLLLENKLLVLFPEAAGRKLCKPHKIMQIRSSDLHGHLQDTRDAAQAINGVHIHKAAESPADVSVGRPRAPSVPKMLQWGRAPSSGSLPLPWNLIYFTALHFPFHILRPCP